jgi:3-hydroxyacyl-[acyl-carrier-protein] dehydratase
MKEKTEPSLRLGSNVIELLIPHRRPLLMVDSIESFELQPEPRLAASRLISANEPVFEGHFPGLHLWPGVYTIEGLGQSCNLLYILVKIVREYEGNPEDLLKALRNLELGFQLHPGFRPDDVRRLVEGISKVASFVGVSTSVDVKLLSPVFAGQRLDYRVRLTHEFEEQLRFEAEALVSGRPVARGVLTASAGFRIPSPSPPPATRA